MSQEVLWKQPLISAFGAHAPPERREKPESQLAQTCLTGCASEVQVLHVSPSHGVQ